MTPHLIYDGATPFLKVVSFMVITSCFALHCSRACTQCSKEYSHYHVKLQSHLRSPNQLSSIIDTCVLKEM